MKLKFDWFPVSEEETSIATLCLNQAINLVSGFFFLVFYSLQKIN